MKLNKILIISISVFLISGLFLLIFLFNKKGTITNNNVENSIVKTVSIEGGGTISLESSDLTNKKVGENINVNLYLDSNKSYSSVDFKLCYGDKVTLSNSDAKKGDDFSEGIVSNNSGNCLTYTAVKTGSEITGKKKVASLKFVASQSGSGSFEVSQSSTKFSGSANNQIVIYKINSVAGVGYSIGK